MKLLRIGKWKIEADPEATRSLHASLASGGADECVCDHCKNFAEQRERVFPQEALHVLSSLGIDPAKECEVYHCGKLKSGRHFYGGWFHFVGRVIGENDRGDDSSLSRLFEEWEEGDLFGSFFISSGADCIRASFSEHQVAQVSFIAELPWVIDAIEPD